jgi:hypothetical protein
MTSALQVGHGAVSPTWAHVAERCWPHLGHPNLTSGAGGGGNVRVFGTATGELQFGQRIVTPISARVAEMCRPHFGHANLRSIASGRRLRGWEFGAAPLLFPRKPHECLSGAAPDFYIGLLPDNRDGLCERVGPRFLANLKDVRSRIPSKLLTTTGCSRF